MTTLRLVRDNKEDEGRAMRLSAAALAPSGPSPSARSWAKPPVAIAGPSRSFLKLTRNPDLESPARFEPTTKSPEDIVI